MNQIIDDLAEEIKIISEKEKNNKTLTENDFKTLFLFSLLKESEDGSKK